jgi:hypothetical protein
MELVLVTGVLCPHSNPKPHVIPLQPLIQAMLRSHFRQAALSLAGLTLAGLLAANHTGSSSPTLGSPAQDAPAEEVADVPTSSVTGFTLEPEWEGLLGTWTLMTFIHPTSIIPAESIRGYLTVTEGFLTMIIHARPSVGENETDWPDHLAQAGLHRWRMKSSATMQTANVMGHSNFGYDLEWELPNEPREFTVTLKGDTLKLTRPDTAELTWRRVNNATFPQAALERMRILSAGGK